MKLPVPPGFWSKEPYPTNAPDKSVYLICAGAVLLALLLVLGSIWTSIHYNS